MKDPATGTFSLTIDTLNKVCISNGLLEALESGFDCLVLTPPRSASLSVHTA